MTVRIVSSLSELQVLLSQPKLTVVDFFATWCGPCKAISPLMENLAASKPHVNFAKVDVDHTPDIMSAYPVRAMPTFFFFKGGNVVEKFEGADINSVSRLVQEHEVVPPPPIPSDEVLETMKPRDLLSLMRQNHIPTIGLVEKSELINEIKKYRK
ncbi:putative mitochondrial Thioredoxin [Leptomonas pyrrhocoris]|uniref:Putative mitochondrial Thioredoxin n=1 Tax=Leptomonas pyrrhocoris TaxID=157538 RepID=A0A0N0DUV6_LEPPY|nr:putative mitochondrial Thioredoxin [Leptomonas pyrrhocoris]KPA79484.1 putative mitochondrial Thioredoxin [Leptomonas pyrrhocoris]|eukprot:XP_015657923.1 putative mitochondrial Thioredoxin [Leptomonas pyrrhocoris]